MVFDETIHENLPPQWKILSNCNSQVIIFILQVKMSKSTVLKDSLCVS